MLPNFNRSLELLDQLETDNIKVLFYDLPPDFSGFYKTYDYSRLCTITKGEKLVSVNDEKQFRYDSSGLLLLSPNSKVHMTIHEPTQAVVFELNPDLVKQVNEKVCHQLSLEQSTLAFNQFHVGQQDAEIKATLNRIVKNFMAGESGREYLIDLYAQELTYYLLRDKGAHQVLSTETWNPVHKAIRYMADNCMQNISIDQLSYELNMSPANFCQYFKKVTKTTPKQYLTRLRLEKAKELLRVGNVTEVAMDLGYSNISHFIGLFKKMYGITPKQYQLLSNFENINSGQLSGE